MSKNTDKLAARLSVLGHSNVHVFWEPIGTALEMCGPSGGWMYESRVAEDDMHGDFLGYSIKEAEEALADGGMHDFRDVQTSAAG